MSRGSRFELTGVHQRAHQCVISAASEGPGNGSEFMIRIPLTSAPKKNVGDRLSPWLLRNRSWHWTKLCLVVF